MAEPVRARRLTDQESRRLLQIVRRGKHGSVRVRRAMIIMGAVLHAHERILGQSGRGAVRSGTHLCHGRLGPPESPALARKLQDYLRWRNAHARHP